MNLDRFTEKAAGRLIKLGRGEAAYHAFVPHPLPPALSLNAKLVRTLSDADRALGELAGLGRAMSNPHLLIGPFVRREAVLSSRIEGTQADLTDLYVYEAGQLPLPGLGTPATESDVHEVANYVGALEYGLERAKTLPINLRLIRELHKRLMKGVRGERTTPGEFRRSQNWIGPAGCTLNDAEFVPPPVAEMQDGLAALEKYLHQGNEHPPLVRLALIHYQFEAIHPFLDGNGRIGRLLISLLLVHWKLLPLPLLYLSAYFEHHRDDYYRLLRAISERGAWAEWLFFFLTGVTEQARDAMVRAKQLQDLQIEWRRKLVRTRASALLLRLADSLFNSPVLTIPLAQHVLGVSYPTARRHVQQLVKAGILKQIGESSYDKGFVAIEILRATGQTDTELA